MIKRSQLAVASNIYRQYSPQYFIEAQKELGTETIELAAVPPHLIIDWEAPVDVSGLKKELEGAGLKVAAVNADVSGYPYRMCTYNETLKNRTIAFYRHAIKAAADLGAEIVTVSCTGAHGDCIIEEEWAKIFEMMEVLKEAAAENNVKIAVETVTAADAPLMNCIADMKRLMDTVDSEWINVCLDICAMRCADETLDDWFKAFGDKIIYLHFTDGRPGGRLVWGEGLHPLGDYLETIAHYGYKGYYGLNIFTRGMWFEDQYLDEEKGWIGTDHIRENYTFAPKTADRKNLEAFKPYLEGGNQ